jgi:hypothetical protein
MGATVGCFLFFVLLVTVVGICEMVEYIMEKLK